MILLYLNIIYINDYINYVIISGIIKNVSFINKSLKF